MQSTQEDKMSREEIIDYVDNLIEANKRTYDKRLAPLLYEFFLRANEKFEWSREEFLEKYQNFRNVVKKIKIKKFDKNFQSCGGYLRITKYKNFNGIFINKQMVEIAKKSPECIYNLIINPMFHECLHATDLYEKESKIIQFGMYEVIQGKMNKDDTMINEYANVLCSTIISSDMPMYDDNLAIYATNNVGFAGITLPGSIICAAFDMSEIELAKLKDKGRNAFNLYLENKFSKPGEILDSFKGNLNIMFNAYENHDKENIALTVGNIVDVAFTAINERVQKIFNGNEKVEEGIERVYYNIFKIQKLLEEVDSIYEIEDDKEIYNFERFGIIEKLFTQLKLYKRFVNNKNLFTTLEQDQIHRGIAENAENIVKELIEGKIGQEYLYDEFNIEEIAKKYYLQSNEPLNDNTQLIEQVRKSFIKPTIKENLKNILEIKEKPLLIQESEVELEPIEQPLLIQESEVELELSEKPKFKETLKYEIPIMHEVNEEEKNKNTSRKDEKIMRDGNEDIR